MPRAVDSMCVAVTDEVRSNEVAMPADAERFARGIETLEALGASGVIDLAGQLEDVAPQLADFMVSFAFGDVYARPQLAPAQRQLVNLGALAALGGTEPQLALHIDLALSAGLTPAVIVEALSQVAVYAGFPRALNAVTVARRVFEERGVTAVPDTESE